MNYLSASSSTTGNSGKRPVLEGYRSTPGSAKRGCHRRNEGPPTRRTSGSLDHGQSREFRVDDAAQSILYPPHDPYSGFSGGYYIESRGYGSQHDFSASSLPHNTQHWEGWRPYSAVPQSSSAYPHIPCISQVEYSSWQPHPIGWGEATLGEKGYPSFVGQQGSFAEPIRSFDTQHQTSHATVETRDDSSEQKQRLQIFLNEENALIGQLREAERTNLPQHEYLEIYWRYQAVAVERSALEIAILHASNNKLDATLALTTHEKKGVEFQNRELIAKVQSLEEALAQKEKEKVAIEEELTAIASQHVSLKDQIDELTAQNQKLTKFNQKVQEKIKAFGQQLVKINEPRRYNDDF